jgi:3-dehydroquinate dehydratase-2
MTRILLIQGANMEWLGKRQPEFYGTTTAAELDEMMREAAKARDVELEIVYTNLEGVAIDHVYRVARGAADGLLMNPAGFSYSGYALRDSLLGTRIPYIEVHMTNQKARGIDSVISSAASGVVYGLGTYTYILGLDALIHVIGRDKK